MHGSVEQIYMSLFNSGSDALTYSMKATLSITVIMSRFLSAVKESVTKNSLYRSITIGRGYSTLEDILIHHKNMIGINSCRGHFCVSGNLFHFETNVHPRLLQ